MLASMAECEQTRTLLRAKIQQFPDIHAVSAEILALRGWEGEKKRAASDCRGVRSRPPWFHYLTGGLSPCDPGVNGVEGATRGAGMSVNGVESANGGAEWVSTALRVVVAARIIVSTALRVAVASPFTVSTALRVTVAARLAVSTALAVCLAARVAVFPGAKSPAGDFGGANFKWKGVTDPTPAPPLHGRGVPCGSFGR